MNEQERNDSQNMGDYTDDLNLKDILAFFKLRFKRLLLRMIITGSIMVLVMILCVLLAPKTSIWTRNIMVLLPKRDNIARYPSGKPFSSADLLSNPVLQQVYQRNNLKGRMDFKDFVSSFFMTNSDIKKAILDAEYREKMGKKNISVIDLQNLEQEYAQKLQMLTSDLLAISMTPDVPLTKTQITKILNDIPELWYQIYSKLEARDFPQIDMATMRQEIIQASKQPGRLILLDKTRVYCNQLLAMCNTLNEMLQGQNVSLPSGEFLGDIQQQLRNIQQYKIDVFHQYILMNSSYQGVFDKIFICSKLQNIEQELLKLNRKYDGTLAAIKLLQTSVTSKNAENISRSSAKTAEAPLTLQLDNTFFNQFAEMIRNDVNNKLRATYAQKTLEYADSIASLEADKIYFQNLLNSMNAKQQTSFTLNPEQFNKLLQEMYTELFSVGGKVVQFRDKILKDYLNSRTFYTPVGNVQYYSEYSIPIVKILLGLFALWLFINLAWGVYDFCLMNAKGLLQKNR